MTKATESEDIKVGLNINREVWEKVCKLAEKLDRSKSNTAELMFKENLARREAMEELIT